MSAMRTVSAANSRPSSTSKAAKAATAMPKAVGQRCISKSVQRRRLILGMELVHAPPSECGAVVFIAVDENVSRGLQLGTAKIPADATIGVNAQPRSQHEQKRLHGYVQQ